MAGRRVAETEHDEHWQRLSRVEADLDVIKPEVSALKTDVSYIRSSMEQLLSKQNQPVPWGTLVSGVMAIVVILGGYTTLITQPISSNVASNAKHVQELEKELDNRSFRFGTLDKGMEWHSEWLQFIEQQMDAERARTADIEERIARLEGLEKTLRDQVNSIDNGGSRVWNDRERQ